MTRHRLRSHSRAGRERCPGSGMPTVSSQVFKESPVCPVCTKFARGIAIGAPMPRHAASIASTIYRRRGHAYETPGTGRWVRTAGGIIGEILEAHGARRLLRPASGQRVWVHGHVYDVAPSPVIKQATTKIARKQSKQAYDTPQDAARDAYRRTREQGKGPRAAHTAAMRAATRFGASGSGWDEATAVQNELER